MGSTDSMREELKPEKPVGLSICCIVGDEGIETLGRMLKSILIRPTGPLCDEIVISWNGKNDTGFVMQLQSAFPDRMFDTDDVNGSRGEVQQCEGTAPRLVVHRQEWRGDFAQARNENFALASGAWRMYLDSDDVVPSSDNPDDRQAIDDCLRAYGITPAQQGEQVGPPKTLMDYLGGLPAKTNVVVLPYDYTIGGDGKCLERHPRRRIMRWGSGFEWRKEDYFHEDVRATGGNVENSVFNAGLPIRHFPSRPVDERAARNRAILKRVLEETNAGKRPVDARLHYNCATFALRDGAWAEAAQLLSRAIGATLDMTDEAIYRQLRAKALFMLGQYDEAVIEANVIIGARPETNVGWLLLQQIAAARGQWAASLEYYQIASSRAAMPEALDHPVEREVHSRVLVADACLALRRWDDALRYAREALAGCPGDALARDCVKRCEERVVSYRQLEGAISLATSYLEQRDLDRAEAALAAIPPRQSQDPRVLALRRCVDSLVAEKPIHYLPLPIFKAPSPWARYVGQWALREGKKNVLVYGRPHPDDIEALRRIVPEVQWYTYECHGEEPIKAPEGVQLDGTVAVDLCHTSVAGQPGHYSGGEEVFTFPAPGVFDLARRCAPDLHDLVDIPWVRDLRLVQPTRPDSDVPRIVGRLAAYLGPFGVGNRRLLTIFAPHFMEAFGPDSIYEGGCGGSEEAIVYLAPQLAKFGYKVRVWGAYDPPGGLEVRDGVEWRHIRGFVANAPHGIFIAHRAPWVVDHSEVRKNSDRVLVWHHDHDYHDDGAFGRAAVALEHLFVSRWQIKSLAESVGVLPDELLARGAIVGNGIPPEEFQWRDAPRDARRVLYCSQPQRGLAPLLRAWSYVVEMEPEAQLAIYYGWRTAEFLARGGTGGGTQAGIWEAMREIKELESRTRNVTAYGRVPQSQLAAEMLRSGVWAYHCVYPEVSCIAGLRAAAAGMIPVFTSTAALPEVQPDHTYMTPDDATPKRFAEAIVKAMHDETFDRRGLNAKVCEENSWANVARKIDEYLRR